MASSRPHTSQRRSADARRTSVDAAEAAAAAEPLTVSDGGSPPQAIAVVLGTCASLVAYGLLQERVMSRAFGVEQERFAFAVFLVAANRLFAIALVAALHVLRAASRALVLARAPSSSSRVSSAGGRRHRRNFLITTLLPLLPPKPPVAPLGCYARVALSNALATLCQYEALRHVSFIAASLAKTAKALPVLLWGLVPGRRKRRHTAGEAATACLLAVGCLLFAVGGRGGGVVVTATTTTTRATTATTSFASLASGAALLAAYLAFDGWTSTEQERLYARYGGGGSSVGSVGGSVGVVGGPKPTTTTMDEGDQLLYTSACSALLTLTATVLSGQLLPALAFLRRHNDAAWAVAGLSAASAATQLLIGAVVRRHGALVFAQMMTSRQLASVLLSAIVYGHALAPLQWLGVAVAFGAIFFRRRGAVGGGLGWGVQRRSGAAAAAAATTRLGRAASMPYHPHHPPELVGVVVVKAPAAASVGRRPSSCGGGKSNLAADERAPLLMALPITVQDS
jgi:adenosine 3'-phospho 5'-phosphosulfate transporter B2